MTHPACLPPNQLLAECEWTFTRRTGPGGQHRHKVSSAAVLRHIPTGIEAEANERRSQAANRAAALRRLRIKLAVLIRTPVHDEVSPSRRWKQRLRGKQIVISARHEEFPCLLAEALDTLARHDGHVPEAAAHLGCTPTQLVRLLRREPSALASVNQTRAERGLHPLR